MIRNKKQAAVARKKRAKLLDAISHAAEGRDSSLLQLISDLELELAEYESIQDGRTNVFTLDSIDDLGDAVVKARLARGWSQRQLAGVLGVSEQMIQKDESRSYARAGIARIADIADALGYELTGLLVPTYMPMSNWRIFPAAIQAGVGQPIIMAGFSLTAASSTAVLAGTVQAGMYGQVPTPYGIGGSAHWSNSLAVGSMSRAIGPSSIAVGELWTGPNVLGRSASGSLGTLSTGALIEKAGSNS